jgi:multicomponent Na+:H+ antiporter subunit D
MSRLGLGIAAAYVVSFTILVASIIALSKDNLKARLAYSTVSQLSYIILGAVLLSPSGMLGGIMHIANHAFSKITLFFCAGSLYCAAHKTEISQLSSIGKKMPWTMAAFFIASLSMIGVPPVAGFTSKWYLALGSIEAKEFPILAVLLVSTVLNAAYFLPITYKAFFEKEKVSDNPGHSAHDHHEEIREIPMVVAPLVLTAIISLLLGIFPDYFLNLAKEVIR